MQNLRQFELLENLDSGCSAKAALLRWDGRRYVRSRDVVEIHEYVGVHGLRGDRGFGILSDDSGQWEATSVLNTRSMQWA